MRILTILTLSCLLSAHSVSQAQESDNPVFQAVKAQLKDPKKPFAMLVRLPVKADMAEKFEAAAKAAIAATRKEKGCISYDLNKSASEENVYGFYEKWASLAALGEHMETDHIKKFLETVGPMLDGEPEILVGLPVGESK